MARQGWYRRMPLRGYRCQFAFIPRLARSFVLSFQDRLCVDRDVDRVADNDPAFVNDIIPADAEIVAVDPGLGDEPGPHLRTLVYPFSVLLFPPRSSPLAEVVDLELNLARHPSDRQRASQDVVARACDFYLIARECDAWVILDIQKISTAEVRVTLRLSRPDGSGIDGHFRRRLAWILRSEDQ